MEELKLVHGLDHESDLLDPISQVEEAQVEGSEEVSALERAKLDMQPVFTHISQSNQQKINEINESKSVSR